MALRKLYGGRPLAVSLGLLLLTGAMAACVTTRATRLGTGSARPAIPPEQVAIYRTAAQVPGHYEEVALLTSSGSASMTDEAQMFESMRKKAAALGANGVILDALTEPGAGVKVAAAVLGVAAPDRKGKAIAIYVFPRDSAEVHESAR